MHEQGASRSAWPSTTMPARSTTASRRSAQTIKSSATSTTSIVGGYSFLVKLLSFMEYDSHVQAACRRRLGNGQRDLRP